MGSGPLAAPAESPGLLRVGSWRRLADGPGKRGLAAGADPRRPPALPDGHGHRGHHEPDVRGDARGSGQDRKSTRLNSSHGYISYAVFCLKKKKHRTTGQIVTATPE